MSWTVILKDPQLVRVLDEYFDRDIYSAFEKGKRLFLERQDELSLILLGVLGPYNFFPSPSLAKELNFLRIRIGLPKSECLEKFENMSEISERSVEPWRFTASQLQEPSLSNRPPIWNDAVEMSYYTAFNYYAALNLKRPLGEFKNAQDYVKLYHRALTLMYYVGVGFLDRVEELERTLLSLEKAGIYMHFPAILHAFVSGKDDYMYRARNFYALIGNEVMRGIFDSVIRFLKGEEFQTYGIPLLEQLAGSNENAFPVLRLPLRFARAMMEGKYFVSLSGKGGVFKGWREVRLPRHESLFKVVAFYKVGAVLGVGGRRFVLDNAQIIFPKSSNPTKAAYDHLSRARELLHSPSDVSHAIRYGVILSGREEDWVGYLRRPYNIHLERP